MKIKGRLIATLAALGLLIAMLPIGPASAAAGVVTLSGGSAGGSGGPGGAYFSDKGTYNVYNVSVLDADLSPVRIGNARFVTAAQVDKGNTLIVSLQAAFVSGEQSITEKFDGGVHSEVEADDKGDVIQEGADTPNVSTDDYWHVNLSQVLRDGDNDGDVDEDDLTVLVNGAPIDWWSGVGTRVGYVLGHHFPATPGADDMCDDARDQDASAVTIVDKCYGNGYNRISLLAAAPDATDTVQVTYEYTEYEFNNSTPITISGSRINHGTGEYAEVTDELQISGVSSLTATITSTGAPDDILADSKVVAAFAYDVKDSAKGYVTLTSATGGERKLDGEESGARTNSFESAVGLFDSGDYTRIVEQSKNLDNDSDGSDSIQISELDNTEVLGEDLQDKIEAIAPMLGFATTDEASDLIDMLVPVRDGETLTASYLDANPQATISKSASIDLAPPTVTMVEPSPADGSYTNETLFTLSAEVTDSGSSVVQANIELTSFANLTLGDAVYVPIVEGFRVTKAPSAVQEGLKEWYVRVVDNVGNVPVNVNDPDTTANDAVKGAAPKGSVSINPFKFTVDTTGPTLTSGRTGVTLKNQGVTSGDDADIEVEVPDNAEWLRVNFNLGDGGAPIDPATVSASDFRVDDAEPLAVQVNAREHGDDTTTTTKGSGVYLQVGKLNTDDRPQIDLVGEIRDRAGNPRTSGRLSAITDGLSPEVTVTPSSDIAQKEVTVTITTSEPLGVNPGVMTTTQTPVGGAVGDAPRNQSVSLLLGSLVTWTVTVSESGTSKQYVVVEARDRNGNTTVIGDGKSSNGGAALDKDDLVSFQIDSDEPSLKFVDATGNDLKDSKQEEGAVWLVSQFDEDEHDGDEFRKITVSEMTLKVKDGEDVTTDKAMLFGDDAEVDCADHDNSDLTDKCVNITLAVNLTPGTYTYSITGRDLVGNEKTSSVEFKVVETVPFKLNLKPGVNLVSIPGAVKDDGGMLDVMLADAPVSTVLTYDSMAARAGSNPWLTSVKDPETGVFSGDITMIEPGKSYFITSTASYTVNVKLEPAGGLPPTLSVRQGYNSIGFMSISGDTETDIELYLNSIGWTVAYSYDPTPGIGWTTIRKGQSTEDNPILVKAGVGYLVYASYDSTLTP